MSEPLIQVIGDSHTEYFSLKSPWLLQRMLGNAPPLYRTEANVVRGAPLSDTRMREATKEALALKPEYMILNFGQVDLELAFYLKRAIKGEGWTPETYVDYLAEVYDTFLGSLDIGKTRLAIKGVNLTVLNIPQFALGYTARAIDDKSLSGLESDVDKEEARRKLKAVLLSERQQNDMHLAFNARVRSICVSRGHGYFDINDYLSAKTPRGRVLEPRTLAPEFMSSKFDHHITPSIGVVQAHYTGAGKVFGLDAD